jgi:Protein of unknown function (DUF3224)
MPSPALLIGRGSFEIKLDFQPAYDTTDGLTLGRASFTKQLQGDLTGTSAGEMLSTLTAVKGSAGYVAQERITGTLHGRSGSFVVHHVGRMNRGASELTITIIPDSGTGELTGIAGTMTIEIIEKRHFYTITYTLD